MSLRLKHIKVNIDTLAISKKKIHKKFYLVAGIKEKVYIIQDKMKPGLMWIYTHPPGNGICVQKVGKKLGNIAKLVCVQTMNSFKLLTKDVLIWLNVLFVQLAESLSSRKDTEAVLSANFFPLKKLQNLLLLLLPNNQPCMHMQT